MQAEPTLHAGIIVDPLASGLADPEQEIQEIFEKLKSWGLPVELKVSGHGMQLFKERLDILVIDYGGLSIGAGDTAAFQVREAVRWAQEHPGSVLTLWSKHTWRIYHYELEEEFPPLENLLFYYPPTEKFLPSEEHWAHQDAVRDRVRAWFNVQTPIPQPEVGILIEPPSFFRPGRTGRRRAPAGE